jgi:hypothetical protein
MAHFFKVPMNANNGFQIQARSVSTEAVLLIYLLYLRR